MREIEIAFALLRGALHCEEPHLGTKPLETSTWWSVFKLLQRNHVAALAGSVLSKVNVPREVLMPWLAECTKAADWNRYQQEVQNDIISVMKQHGIETLVLKGTHTAQYYPKPELREFGDLDLFFYDKHDKADRIASEILKVDVSNNAHHHSKYNYRGVTVESHYDFINRHYPPSNHRYEALLKKLVLCTSPKPGEVADQRSDGGVCLKDSLSTFEVLFLLRHMAGHFASSRITLRDLIDWYLTCRTLNDKVDWNLIQKTVKSYGMERFARALNLIVEHRLGYVIPLTFNKKFEYTQERDIVERDIVYGNIENYADDGFGRLIWKVRRWKTLGWKRRMVYRDGEISLLLTGLVSHAEKPQSILHKM